MSVLTDAVAWLADGEHWQGKTGVPTRLREHLSLSVAATAAAFAVAFPLAFWLGHRRVGGTVAVNAANVGRALPSMGILLLAVQLMGLAEWPVVGSGTTFVTLSALALAPILTTTYVGMAEVADPIRDAAVAMGFSGWQRATRVELPLALPLVVGGVRTAVVQVIATATLAALVGGGGLGRFIIDGSAVRDHARVISGAFLVALVAIVADAALGLLARRLQRRPND